MKEDKEIGQEQIAEKIIPSAQQIPFFGQCQISLPPVSSSGIAILSFASLALTGLQSLFGGYHELQQYYPNHQPMFFVYVGVSKTIMEHLVISGCHHYPNCRNELSLYMKVLCQVINVILLLDNFYIEVDYYMYVQMLGDMYNTG